MQIRTFLKARTKKRKLIYCSSSPGLLHISQSYFKAMLYRDLGFLSLFYTRVKKVMFRALLTVNLTIFQNVIASRVYIFSGCERILQKEQFFLFVTLKACFWSPKASALDENESEKYTLTIFLFLMCSANIDSSNTSSSSRTLL